ncbi:MAG TPA: hypothetical protein VNX68_16905, partial [Nitrosopumilaceae archaeon]|nr:hypothetical protein [Nitrosopumilaceae archaeon]
MMYNRYFLLSRSNTAGPTLIAAIASAVAGEAVGTNQVSINSIFAINGTQCLVVFNVVNTVAPGVTMNQGDLRTYANKIAADLATASGDT